MNQARDIKTGEVLEAETLKYIYEDNLSEYECTDDSCKVKLIPCSYKPHNKNRPYFKSVRGGNHSNTCTFSAYLKLLERGRKRALTEIELEDMPFPTKLGKLKKSKGKNTIYKSDVSSNVESKTGGRRKKASGEFVEMVNRSKVVNSLSSIVDFYIKCPFNRNVELEIENIKREYMYWFRRISKSKSEGKYKGTRIFFGRLHTDKNKIEETDHELKITMYECEGWEEVKTTRRNQRKSKKQVNPFVISVDKTQLSKHKISRILNEIDYTIEDKKAAFKKEEEEDKKRQAFVFFYGEAPKPDNPYTFRVNDGILVARYCKILPTKQQHEIER